MLMLIVFSAPNKPSLYVVQQRGFVVMGQVLCCQGPKYTLICIINCQTTRVLSLLYLSILQIKHKLQYRQNHKLSQKKVGSGFFYKWALLGHTITKHIYFDDRHWHYEFMNCLLLQKPSADLSTTTYFGHVVDSALIL